MSQIETPESTPEDPAVAPETVETPEPEPEPWTPERVIEWNRYYDLYVAGAVIILLLVVSSHRVVNSSFWVHIQTGRQMVQKAGLLLVDPFSYSVEGKPWTHVSWLFDLAAYGLYQAGGSFSSNGAVPTVVAVNAVLVAIVGVVLLMIRRKGPGLWWSAICVLMAMGLMIAPSMGQGEPLLLALGGIAGRSVVEPETWGMLLLAIELLILDRGIDRIAFEARGSSRVLLGLVPIFLLWVNLDSSFLFGLLIAMAWLVGSALRGVNRLKIGFASGVIAASVVACLINPSLYRAFAAGLSPLFDRFVSDGPPLKEYLSFVSPESLTFFKRQHGDSNFAAALYPAYYVVVVLIGLLSFAINRRRFSLGRFLGYLVAAIAWGLLVHYSFVFAPVFAAVVALNGQEWYLDRFGVEGKLGRGWSTWSIGGRAITLLVLIAALLRGLTGFGGSAIEPPFAFNFIPWEFPFEAAKVLRDPKIEGNVLNLDLEQGDALIWQGFPDRPCYVDSRPDVYSAEIRKERSELRVALRDGKKDLYKPILDRRNISVIMISPRREPRTYLKLAASDDFILFHDDGNSALFGRADAPPSAVAYFKDRRLDANEVIYKRPATIPISDRPPTATGWIDKYFTARLLVPIQPHDFVAGRWLESGMGPGGNLVPDPAYCMAAIREARIALSNNPDDHQAYILLAKAYNFLALRETEILARGGSTATPLPLRIRQRAAALNYAIQTAPPDDSTGGRRELALLNMELAQLFRSLDILDLQSDRLQAASELLRKDEFPESESERLSQLKRSIDEIQNRINDQAAAQQAGPAQRAQMAQSVGLIGLAIRELKEADALGGNNATVRWQLLDLYCQTGQPDQAQDMLGNPGDTSLANGPGTAYYRQGLVYFLLGNSETASSSWDQAVLQVRSSMTYQAMEGFRSILLGAPQGVAAFQELPGRVVQESNWEFDLGLCLLEGGNPDRAATSLAKTIELSPRFAAGPLVAYYLDKLGKPLTIPTPAIKLDVPKPAN